MVCHEEWKLQMKAKTRSESTWSERKGSAEAVGVGFHVRWP